VRTRHVDETFGRVSVDTYVDYVRFCSNSNIQKESYTATLQLLRSTR